MIYVCVYVCVCVGGGRNRPRDAAPIRVLRAPQGKNQKSALSSII